MPLLVGAFAFITQPPGAWLHALVLLASIQFALVLAVRRWRAMARIPSSRSVTSALRPVFARMAIALAALLAARLALLAASLALPSSSPEALRLLPPLERAVVALTTLLFVWSMAFPQPALRADVWVAGLSLASLAGLAATWGLWTPALATAGFYNGSFTESLWTVANLLLLVSGFWLLLVRRERGWGAAVIVVALLLAGQGLHYLYPVAGSDVPAAVRWAELAAVPLGVLMLYQRGLGWPVGAQARAEAAAEAQALAEAMRQQAEREPKHPLVTLLETLLVACLFFVAIEGSTGRFRVDGPSMQPTLHTGQYVLTDKLAYRLGEPRRGDVVIVRVPPLSPTERPRELIKRVVALPGETVTIGGGQLHINNWPYPELYVLEAPAYSGSWTLGPDEYFVLGDNRNNSSDSHVWGPIVRQRFIGKALLVYWPPREWVLVAHAQGR